MYLICLLTIIVILGMSVFISVVCESVEGFFITLCMLAFPLLWFIYYSHLPWEYKVETYLVHSIEGVDIIVVDDKVFNMNGILNKDFNEGDLINVKFPVIKSYKGIIPAKLDGERLVFEHANKKRNRD